MKKRKSVRLKDYDYSQEGAYFITICVRSHRCIFWKNDNDKGENMVSPLQNQHHLNDIGLMVDKWWRKMFEKYSNEIVMDQYVIMPNHIHGIIIIRSKNKKGENMVSPVQNHVGGNVVSPVQSHVVGAIPCNRPNENGGNVVSPVQNYVVGAIPCNRPNKIPNTRAGIGRYISWFKRMATNEYIHNVKNNNWTPFDKKLWQRNYYEHIIRNEYDWYYIFAYIDNNPLKWEEDKYFSMKI